MIRFSFFAICLLLAGIACKNKQHPDDPLTETIAREEARYDIRFIRDLLEETHPSLNDYLSPQRVNTIFDSITSTLPSVLTLRDLHNKIYWITNQTGCSHTIANLPTAVMDTLYNRKLFFPMPVILIENKLYVNSDHELGHGTRILSVNGKQVDAILDSLTMYNPVDGYQRSVQRTAAAEDFAFEYFLRFGCPKRFEIITQEKDGKPETHSYEPVTLTEANNRYDERYYYDAEDVTYFFRINDKYKYAVMRITDFSMPSDNGEEAFENFLKNSFELLTYRKDIGNLIIDLRQNTGGWLYNCFLLYSYICNREFAEYKQVFTRLTSVPAKKYLVDNSNEYDTSKIRESLEEEFIRRTAKGRMIPDSLIRKWKPDRHRFTGRVFIITNHAVSSAASYFTSLAKNGINATVVGVETAGGACNSNGFFMLKYQLPISGIRVTVPYARMQYDTDSSGRGRGVLPDYYKPDTYQSFSENEDLQIKFIIDSILLKNR